MIRIKNFKNTVESWISCHHVKYVFMFTHTNHYSAIFFDKSPKKFIDKNFSIDYIQIE